MDNQGAEKHIELLPNLKICLEFVEAYFRYLPYVKIGKLKYSLTYSYDEKRTFNNIIEIILEIERCIEYQRSKKNDINISAEIVLKQDIFIERKEINLFYSGQIMINRSTALILWNWYQNTPAVKIQLIDTIPPREILMLFENFHTAIKDINTKHE